MKANIKIGIIILHYGKVESTDKCLESLSNIKEPPIEILVIDNCSPEPFRNSKYYNNTFIQKIYSNKNLGFSGGNNLGINFFLKQNVTHILFLNNDTIVESDFLEKLYECSLNYKIGMFSPVLYDIKTKSPMEFGGELDSFKMYFYELPNVPNQDATVSFLCGGCILYSMETFKKVGYWDEQFFMYSEDMDYCIRANRIHVPLIICTKAKVYHEKGGASGGLAPFAIYYIHRNRILLARKYHFHWRWFLFLIYYTNIILVKVIKWFFRQRELCKWFWLGFWDGLCGKKGRSERNI